MSRKSRKMTPRKQIAEWMEQDNIDVNEDSISFIFRVAMFLKERQNISFRSAYCEACVRYQNEISEGYL